MPNKDSTRSWPEIRPCASQVVIDRLAALAWASIAAGAMDGLIKKTKESESAAGKGSSAGNKESVGESHEGKEGGGVGAGKGRKRKAGCDGEEGGGGGGGKKGKKGKKGGRGGVVGEKNVDKREEIDEDEKEEEEEEGGNKMEAEAEEWELN
ncbi:hypothetical protein B0A50_08682 [Salinomyces thailandicus]|uniref:Uncharacterized protein n=1 Tax=Salinomyces thailandicus TaxID=706561 RepID=A0A4U0TJ45_9PEZI|nr:hypothetical protein B0A50_08682 [Salinomyces thailandica]